MTSIQSKGIVWIASYPYSGGTWVSSVLDKISTVIAGNAGTATSCARGAPFSRWDISAAPSERLIGKPVAKCSRAEIARARHQVQTQVAELAGGPALVKTHCAAVMDHHQPVINFAVTSRVIYIVRNPMDVAVSLANSTGRSLDDAIEFMGHCAAEHIAPGHGVHEIFSSWWRHVGSWTGKPQLPLHTLRYEDILSAPDNAFFSLSRNLGLSPTRSQIRKAIELCALERPGVRETVSASQGEAPACQTPAISFGGTGYWRKRLSKCQIDRVISTHRTQMGQFGYLPGI